MANKKTPIHSFVTNFEHQMKIALLGTSSRRYMTRAVFNQEG